MQDTKQNRIKIDYNIGSLWGNTTFKMAISLFLTMFLLFLVFFIFGTLFIFDSFWLSLVVNLAFIGLCGTFYFNMGATEGEKQAALSEILFKKDLTGEKVSPEERNRSFKKAKGFLAVSLALLPFMLLCLYFAFTTKIQYYNLGSLPTWLDSYLEQSQLGIALQYYQQETVLGLDGLLRLLVRSMNIPYVAIMNSLGPSALLWVERLSPLLILIIPSGYGFGYMHGEQARINVNKAISSGQKRKSILETRKKRPKPQEKKQLL